MQKPMQKYKQTQQQYKALVPKTWSWSNLWFVGFVDGEGCFTASVIDNKTMRYGYQIQPEFVVTQHQRDRGLLYGLAVHFECGHVTKNKGKNDTISNTMMWRVRKNEDLCNIIIPFFQKHKQQTQKFKEFELFAQICFLLQEKNHLTEAGSKQCLEMARELQAMRLVFHNAPGGHNYLYIFYFIQLQWIL